MTSWTPPAKPKDTRTTAQKEAMYARVKQLIEQSPGATVHGHNEFAAKACPCFDVQEDWSAWQEQNSDLSPDITPGLRPEDMRDEDFDDGTTIADIEALT